MDNETRRDTILWDDETKRRAQWLAELDDRSMSAEIRYLVDQEYERRTRPTVLVSTSGRYEVQT